MEIIAINLYWKFKYVSSNMNRHFQQGCRKPFYGVLVCGGWERGEVGLFKNAAHQKITPPKMP